MFPSWLLIDTSAAGAYIRVTVRVRHPSQESESGIRVRLSSFPFHHPMFRSISGAALRLSAPWRRSRWSTARHGGDRSPAAAARLRLAACSLSPLPPPLPLPRAATSARLSRLRCGGSGASASRAEVRGGGKRCGSTRGGAICRAARAIWQRRSCSLRGAGLVVWWRRFDSPCGGSGLKGPFLGRLTPREMEGP